MKKTLTALAFCLILGLAFWAGKGVQEEYWASAVDRERRHHQLSDLRTCFYVIEADTLRFVLLSEGVHPSTTLKHGAICRKFIEDAGSSTADENFGRVMGEMLLFYDGYLETIREILARQIMLTIAQEEIGNQDWNDEVMQELKTLAEEQGAAITDIRQFLKKFDELIERAW